MLRDSLLEHRPPTGRPTPRAPSGTGGRRRSPCCPRRPRPRPASPGCSGRRRRRRSPGRWSRAGTDRGSSSQPPPAADVGAGEDVAVVVERDLRRQPRRLGVRTDQDEEAARLEPGSSRRSRRSARRSPRVTRRRAPPRPPCAEARRCSAASRSGRRGSATCSSRAPSPRQRIVTLRAWFEKNIAACPAELPGADEVDVEAVRARGLAPRGAVGDALAGQPVEAVHLELPPCDAARQDDRPRPQHVAAVEVHLAGGGSIRVIVRVTTISAPSRRACWSARLASSSPETPDGKPR